MGVAYSSYRKEVSKMPTRKKRHAVWLYAEQWDEFKKCEVAVKSRTGISGLSQEQVLSKVLAFYLKGE